MRVYKLKKSEVNMQNSQKATKQQDNGDVKEQLLKELLEQNRKLADKVEKLEQGEKQAPAEKHDPDFYKRILIVVSVVVGVGLLIFLVTTIQRQNSEIYKQQQYQKYYEDITEQTRPYVERGN